MMRNVLPALACLATLSMAACGPLSVRADPGGTQKLPLHGETSVTGVVTRALAYGDLELPKGTTVRVEETWLLRHDKSAKPPGYRISGLYDPTVRSDGLALPKHAVDTFYYSAILPKAERRVPIPAAFFQRDSR